jgi:hypothetical protein
VQSVAGQLARADGQRPAPSDGGGEVCAGRCGRERVGALDAHCSVLRRTVCRKQVARSAPGPDDVLTPPGRQLGAEPPDVNVDHAGERVIRVVSTRARRCPRG